MATEPAISEVELHQVVTADVPSGERTHVLRQDDCFGLFNEIGDIDAETRSEAGLYRGGVRHLSRLTLTIAGMRPLLLAATLRDDNVLLTMNLTNGDVRGEGGRVVLPRGTLHITRSRYIWEGVCYEMIRVRNFALSTVRRSSSSASAPISKTSSTCAHSAASMRRARASSASNATA